MFKWIQVDLRVPWYHGLAVMVDFSADFFRLFYRNRAMMEMTNLTRTTGFNRAIVRRRRRRDWSTLRLRRQLDHLGLECIRSGKICLRTD